MKKIHFLFVVISLFLSVNLWAQMLPPPPINSPQVDAIMGTWVSEPYEMMGMKMTDEASHRMILNGQFLEIDIKATGDKGFVYEAKGIMAPNNDGTMTGWMFDIFGKNGITQYTGSMSGNTITVSGKNDMMSETRVITYEGDTMIHNVSFTIKDPTGKEMPQQKIVITYKKKN